MNIQDSSTGQAISAAELRAEIKMLEELAASSLNKWLEGWYMDMVAKRKKLLARLEGNGHRESHGRRDE